MTQFATAYNARALPGKQIFVVAAVTAASFGYFYYLKERHFRRHPETKPRSEVVAELHSRYHYAGNSMRQDFNAFDYSHVSQVGLRTIESKDPLEEEEIEERTARLEKLKEEVNRAIQGASLDSVWEEKEDEDDE